MRRALVVFRCFGEFVSVGEGKSLRRKLASISPFIRWMRRALEEAVVGGSLSIFRCAEKSGLLRLI